MRSTSSLSQMASRSRRPSTPMHIRFTSKRRAGSSRSNALDGPKSCSGLTWKRSRSSGWPQLLEKRSSAVARRGGDLDAERAAALDAMLWTYRDDAFLPHGIAGEETDPDPARADRAG